MERIDILKEPELHLKGEQKRVYKLSSDAPVLVKGSAGSGKTLVAMARARFLRNHWHPIHTKRTCMTLYKTSLFVEKGNYLEAV